MYEFLPSTPYLPEGIRAAQRMDVRPLAYTVPTLWDKRSQSWLRDGGAEAALRTEDGSTYNWNFPQVNNVSARMCPATEQWQSHVREWGDRLEAFGFNGLYFDTIPATFARPCYNPTHGHEFHGGSWFSKGVREMVETTRAEFRRTDPEAAFFGEAFSEYLIDLMDGFLTLDMNRTIYSGGEQPWPIMNTVYGPYTFNFGSDAKLKMGEDKSEESFALLVGRLFVWGTQPLFSDIPGRLPKEGDHNSEVIREIVQAYYTAGQYFLAGGSWRRLVSRPPEGYPASSGLEVIAEPHSVPYSARSNGRNKRIWSGPAVLSSAWERAGNIGIILANITEEPQKVTINILEETEGVSSQSRLLRMWPAPAIALKPAIGSHRIELPPHGAMVLAATDAPDALKAEIRPLLKTEFALSTVGDDNRRMPAEGAMPPVRGGGRALWASDDAVVDNVLKGEEMEGAFLHATATGEFVAAYGEYGTNRGMIFETNRGSHEGHGRPRDTARQPFLLARRLPHKLATGDSARVFLGDAHYLLAEVPGDARLVFAEPGLAVVTDADSGTQLRGVEDEPTSVIEVDGDKDDRYWVAWVAPNPMPDYPAGYYGDVELWQLVRRWVEDWARLPALSSRERPRELARLSRAFPELLADLEEHPEMLTSGGPLLALGEQLQSLVAATHGGVIRIHTQHTWLTPGHDKPMAVRVGGESTRLHQISALGTWREGMMHIGTAREERAGEFTYSLHLDDGLYVNRVVPVLAVAEANMNGENYHLFDLIHLEANRSVEVFAPLEPLSLVAGGKGKLPVVFRNWSPDDVTLHLKGHDTQDGLQVKVEPTELTLPALTDGEAEFFVSADPHAAMGETVYRPVAAYANQGADTEMLFELPASVLGSFSEIRTGSNTGPSAAPPMHLRNRQVFAVYASGDKPIDIVIRSAPLNDRWDPEVPYRLIGPDAHVVAEGMVPHREEEVVRVESPEPGGYYLELYPSNKGGARVTSAQPISEVANKANALTVFQSSGARYLYVPEGAVQFKVGLIARTRAVDLRVVSPTGRVVFEKSYGFNGDVNIKVLPDEAGGIWMVDVDPGYQTEFWIGGSASPFLSRHPEHVLIPEAMRPEK